MCILIPSIEQIPWKWYIDLLAFNLAFFLEVILSSTTATVTYSLFAKYQDVNIQIPPFPTKVFNLRDGISQESCLQAFRWIGDTPSHLLTGSSS